MSKKEGKVMSYMVRAPKSQRKTDAQISAEDFTTLENYCSDTKHMLIQALSTMEILVEELEGKPKDAWGEETKRKFSIARNKILNAANNVLRIPEMLPQARGHYEWVVDDIVEVTYDSIPQEGRDFIESNG